MAVIKNRLSGVTARVCAADAVCRCHTNRAVTHEHQLFVCTFHTSHVQEAVELEECETADAWSACVRAGIRRCV